MKPIVPWLGGKRRLLKHILPLIPEHECYVELFTGGGAVFFGKDNSKNLSVLNDKDGDLVNLYRVIAHHKDEFVRQFDLMLYSREMYIDLKNKKNNHLTDIQRAANYYARLRMSFAKRTDRGQSFGTWTQGKSIAMFNFAEFESAADMLRTAIIENGDWLDVAKRYDRPHSFMFADPPYLQTQGYAVDFDAMEYQKIADFMRNCKGKVMLTINAHPALDDVFEGLKRIEVPIKYSIRKTKKYKESKEWIICNYE